MATHNTYKANEIADWFISRVYSDGEKGESLSHLKLQKLVYYAQAWHYTIFGDKLFEEPIQAWKRGPVIRSIYDRFINVLPYNSIYEKVDIVDFTYQTTNLLEDVYRVYGGYSATYLEDLTHQEEPWIIARGGIPNYANCETEITLESMKEFYGKRLSETQAG